MTPEQRADLQQVRRDRTLRPAERDRIERALLSDAGWAVPRIAEPLGSCAQTVRRVFAQLARTGLAGLRPHKPGPAPDGPRRERVEAALGQLLEQARTWTAGQLATALEEAGLRLSTRQVRRSLIGPGLRARSGSGGPSGRSIIRRIRSGSLRPEPSWRHSKTGSGRPVDLGVS